ncbi:MAG TPA: carbohydrate ABC transporter permease [Casimicrobiaceae bacterium]|nr:carbohydrate ABC transporter permease [Casimicrobiaceae bacterium]
MFPAPLDRRPLAARAGYGAAVVAALAVWLLPLGAVVLTSIRSAADLNRGNFWGWPTEVRFLANYAGALSESHLLQFALSSVLVTLPTVAATVLISSMAGFALAKHRFPGRRLVLATFVAGNLVPFQALMIPVRDLVIALGLYDSRWALILFHTAFQTGFCTLLMRNFIRELPEAVLDAARLDGAGELRIFWHIVLPLVRPAMASVAVLVFTFVWNDYFWSLVLVQSDAVRPLTAGLQALRGMWQTSWQLVCAASVLAALPPVAVFFLMQRHLIAGLAVGRREAAVR